ncbi:MAG: transposase [Planctomycetes bacterium]|nr:transposase [Planctomycetota bacterium]
MKLPAGKWRWLMATDFDDETYGQRWQVETVMFMLKRHLGAALTARKYQTRRREMNLRAITHNLMILLPAM